ncbi:MAG: outer membrane beta-barrel protein [Oligoflexia bacterium]|nr:outer membrane beta-barrel protein [Oligoflexia bacterium]
MKKLIALPLAVVSMMVMSVTIHAADYNEGLKDELNQDIEQLYPKRPKKTRVKLAQADIGDTTRVEVQTVRPAQTQGSPTIQVQQQQQQVQQPAQPTFQPIYIVQPPTQSGQAQVQPATTVEAQAIRESKADQLRKQREDMERQTEDRLTQRLEDDRILSEKERADKLFAPAAAPVQQQQQVVVQPVATPAPAPAPVQQQQQIVVQPVPVENSVVVKTEDTKPVELEQQSKFRVGGLAGVGSYPSVSNVNGAYAAGVAADLQMPDRFGIEASFMYSSYDIKNVTPCYYCYSGQSLVVTMNQMNLSGAATYGILPGRVTPVVGAIVGYTRRNYTNRVSYGYTGNTAISGSNAFDGGLLVGVDISATKKLSVGADVRYLWNISYRTDDALAYTYGPQVGSPIEGLNYYFATLNLKLTL